MGGLVCVAEESAVSVGSADAVAAGAGVGTRRFTSVSPKNAEAADVIARMKPNASLCQPVRIRAWRVR
jgi:hypothetical protein